MLITLTGLRVKIRVGAKTFHHKGFAFGLVLEGEGFQDSLGL